MKIYFAGSISAGRHDVPVYQEIIEFLKGFGEVLTEFIGNSSLSMTGEQEKSDQFIHDRDMEWLLSADVLVAEVTTPSLGVGYEIGRALENKKRILCLYRQMEGKRVSAMIKGAPGISVFEYKTKADWSQIIQNFFNP